MSRVVEPITLDGVVIRRPRVDDVNFVKGSSRTKQAFKDECDINRIMRKYQKTGLISHIREGGRWGEDVSNAQDFQTSLNIVIAAQAAFAALPSDIRNKFGNDPKKLLAFIDDPKNEQELVTLGLARPKEVIPGKGNVPPEGEGASAPLQQAGAGAPPVAA